MNLKFTSEKKNNFFALIAGAFVVLAFAPFHFFVAAIISLSVFYFLLEKATKKKEIFWLGFFFGFGHFLCGIYWIAISLLVDASQFAWLIPFALTLIPSALALYLALFALSYKFFVTKFNFEKTYQKILIFALCWLFFEILRSVLFTGFPWNLLGYVWMFSEGQMQLASVFGIFGLTVFAVLISLFPTLFLNAKGRKKKSEIFFGDKIFAAILILFLVVNVVFGLFHIDEKSLINDHKTTLRLVQANIKQEMKWDQKEKYQNFLKHIELTNSKNLDEVDAVIWSETSVPYVIDDSPELLHKLSLAVPAQGNLITGGLRLEYGDSAKTEISNAWNSAFVLSKNKVTQTYDKHHLVPFGEYVPLQKFLPFIDKITGGGVGFSKGEGAKTLLMDDFSFSPLICYEAIFTQEVIDKNNRPDLFINLTNDAWFGSSSGPYQHFDMTKMRAVEYGISLVRVAGTGISAFIDPFGRVVAKIGLNEEGIVDVDLIKNSNSTIYRDYGFLPLLILIGLMLLSLVISAKKRIF